MYLGLRVEGLGFRVEVHGFRPLLSPGISGPLLQREKAPQDPWPHRNRSPKTTSEELNPKPQNLDPRP